MSALVPIDLACNDAITGEPLQRFYAIALGELLGASGGVQLTHLAGFSFTRTDTHLTVHGVTFSVRGWKGAVGNWVWDRTWMTEADARHLLSVLLAHRWQLDVWDADTVFADLIAPHQPQEAAHVR